MKQIELINATKELLAFYRNAVFSTESPLLINKSKKSNKSLKNLSYKGTGKAGLNMRIDIRISRLRRIIASRYSFINNEKQLIRDEIIHLQSLQEAYTKDLKSCNYLLKYIDNSLVFSKDLTPDRFDNLIKSISNK